ncbi:MAG: hypothetical protein M1548_03815 [Actinobacteria bacterium]|nr:hypothetical protein [Actinomycetota bacterium]
MDIISEAFNIAEIEDALCQLDDVQAARIVVAPDNSIEEIHIVAAPGKGAKQLVRDVETTLMARFGIPVNHRKVSVAQVSQQERPEEVDGNGSKPRLQIASVNMEVTGVRAKAAVTLGMGDMLYEGVAQGASSQTERLRLVAQATLDAVSQFIPSSFCFALEDVTVADLGKEKVAVACITLVGSSGESSLAGSALVRQNDKDSIVRATLDAINRRFSFLKTI